MLKENPFADAENYRATTISYQERRIRKFYRDMYKELQREIKSLDADSSETDRRYLNQLKDELGARINQITLQTDKLIRDGVTTTTERVLENNKTFLNGIGFSNYNVSPQLVSTMADYVISGKLYGGKFSLSSSIWGSGKRTQFDINRIISRGILEHKSTYEIAKQLEKYVNPNVLHPIKSGVMGEVDYNAQRLARTMVQHAYQEAFVASTIDNPFIEAYKWVTSGLSNVCQLCIAREEDDEYGLGAGIYPKDALPLDHPNGNCTFDIVTVWDEDSAREAVMDWKFGDLDDEELAEALERFSESF